MVSELITFDGGLSTKTSPHLIAKNEGIICENVNLETGTLAPLPSMQYIDNVDGKHIYIYEDSIVSSEEPDDDRFYETYNDVLYWTNNGYDTNGLMKYDGTNTGQVADAPDGYPQSTIPVSVTEVSTSLPLLTTGADYTYALTIVDSSTAIESVPIFITAPTLTSGKTLRLSVDETDIGTYFTNNPTLSVNVYRQGGSNPTFNLIIENLTPDTFGVGGSGTGTLYYDDIVADIDVARIELTTFENVPTPDELDMLIEVNGTFWGSYLGKVYFASVGNPLFWSPLDYVKLDKPCTGLGKFGDNIVAFTQTSTYLIVGDTRDTVTLQRLPFNQGCINKHSIVNIDAFLLWTSKNGICMFDGSTIQVLTKKTLAWDEFGRLGNATYAEFDGTTSKWASDLGFDIKYAAGFQDKYYGVYKDGIVILDLSNGLKVSTIDAPNVVSLATNLDDNTLYAVIDAEDGTFDVYGLIDSESKMTATWKTGHITDGSTNVNKHYREVEVEGTPVSVEVFVDGESKFTAYGKSIFKLPAGLYGASIQFEIKTTEEIKGIKYHYSPLRA